MGVLQLAEVLSTQFLIQTEAVEDQEVEVEPVVLTFDVVHYRCTRTAAAASAASAAAAMLDRSVATFIHRYS